MLRPGLQCLRVRWPPVPVVVTTGGAEVAWFGGPRLMRWEGRVEEITLLLILLEN